MNIPRITRLIAAVALSTMLIAGCKRDQVTTAPDGTVTIAKADGTQVVTHPDGSQTITKPDGTQVSISPGGGVATQSANGAQTVVQPNGAVTTTAPNGAQVATQTNGSVVTQPNAGTTNPYSIAPGHAVQPSGVPSVNAAPTQPGVATTAADTNLAPLLVPAGTALSIRLNQHISVKTSHAGDRFTGTVVNPVTVNGNVAIPDGSRVSGVVTESHRRGHFKGRSILQLRLTSLDLQNGGRYALDSSRVTRTKKGKGKRSFGIIGGGTGLGMLVGGIATGGVGLVVGGLAGAGGGTAIAGLTGNRDIDFPAESVITFRLADAIDIR